MTNDTADGAGAAGHQHALAADKGPDTLDVGRNRRAAQDRFHLDFVENQLSTLPEFRKTRELHNGDTAVPGDTNKFRIFLDLALGSAAENQHVEIFRAACVVFQDFDQARPGGHHRNPLDSHAQRRSALDRHDARDGILRGLGPTRKTNDQVSFGELADEQRLPGERPVGVAAEDPPARSVAKKSVIEPGRRDDGERDEEKDDELALVQADDRLEETIREGDAIKGDGQNRAALQDVEEVRRRGEPPHRVVEAAVSEQHMAEDNDAGPPCQARIGECLEREIRPRQHEAERHRDQDHDAVLHHDDGAPHRRPKSRHDL